MEPKCPLCGAKLVYWDHYGNFPAREWRATTVVSGDVYMCPNGRDEEDVCDSETFHVSGAWHTREDGELHEGYPR